MDAHMGYQLVPWRLPSTIDYEMRATSGPCGIVENSVGVG